MSVELLTVVKMVQVICHNNIVTGKAMPDCEVDVMCCYLFFLLSILTFLWKDPASSYAGSFPFRGYNKCV